MRVRSMTAAFLLTAGLLALAVHAHAVGVHFAVWDVEDVDDNGIGFGIHETVSEWKLLLLDVRGSYYRFSDAELNAVPLEAGAFFYVDQEKTRLYGGPGIGFYYFDSSQGDFKNSLGWFLLGGAVYRFSSSFGGYTEIRWNSVDSEFTTQGVPAVDADLNGFGFHVGIAFGKTVRGPEKK